MPGPFAFNKSFGLYLPQVAAWGIDGAYPVGQVPVASLTDRIFGAGCGCLPTVEAATFDEQNEAAPFRYRNVSVLAGGTLAALQVFGDCAGQPTGAIFFHCDTFTLGASSSVTANGQDGGNGGGGCGGGLGAGGNGGSGGGGGAGTISVDDSGNGGNGGSGTDGNSGSGSSPGPGGRATQNGIYCNGYTYNYGNGDDGLQGGSICGCGSPIGGTGGLGGNGYGGGGGGGAATPSCDSSFGGGGAAGGGLIVIVSNTFITLDGSASLSVLGGIGGFGAGGVAGEFGGNGGKGRIAIFTRAMLGPAPMIGGNLSLWDIRQDSNIIARNLGENWSSR